MLLILLAGKVWNLDVPKSHLKPRNSMAMLNQARPAPLQRTPDCPCFGSVSQFCLSSLIHAPGPLALEFCCSRGMRCPPVAATQRKFHSWNHRRKGNADRLWLLGLSPGWLKRSWRLWGCFHGAPPLGTWSIHHCVLVRNSPLACEILVGHAKSLPAQFHNFHLPP